MDRVGAARDSKGLSVGVKGLLRASGGDICGQMKGPCGMLAAMWRCISYGVKGGPIAGLVMILSLRWATRWRMPRARG